MKIFYTMNIVVIDIVDWIEFDADSIHAISFLLRALLKIVKMSIY